MKKRQAKKKSNIFRKDSRDFPFGVLLVVAIVILGVIFAVVEIFPVMRPIRDALWYRIVQKLLLSAVVLYGTYLGARTPPLFAKIALTVSLILYIWASLLIHADRILMLLDTGVLFILLFCALYLYLRRKEHYTVLTGCTAFVGLFNLLEIDRYTFVNNPEDLHFWLVPVLVSVVPTVVCAVLLYKRKIVLEDNRFSERFLLPIIVFGCSAAILWSTINNLNYALDTSAPTVYATSIASKSIQRHSRGPNDYVFCVNINGDSVTMYVSHEQYDAHNVGDPYPILLCDGAFSDPYYIPQEL